MRTKCLTATGTRGYLCVGRFSVSDRNVHAPAVVTRYESNAHGIYCLAGNVWEYVADRWRDRS